MLALERMQRFSFRLADLTCSVIAFTAAYQTLLPARNVLQRFLPAYLVEGGDLFPAVAGKEIPPPQDLSWIFVIAALAVSITVEYANDSRPVRIRSYINIFFIQL